MFSDAVAHQSAGRLAEADRLAEMILRIEPRHANSLHIRGLIAQQQGRNQEAVEFLQRALRLARDNPLHHYALANMLKIHGRIDAAVTHYRRALESLPDVPEAAEVHNNFANALCRRGRLDEAQEHYERALALDPDYALAHGNLGALLAGRGQVVAARGCYERALALRPDWADISNALGMLLAGEKDFKGAGRHFEHAIAVRADFTDAHSNLGATLMMLGDFSGARRHLESALALDPGLSATRNNLANACKACGSFGEALAHYDQVISERPDYVEAHFDRASVTFFRRGDPELAALEALAARDNLAPERAVYVHFALAKALEDCGDYARAFSHLHLGNDLKRARVTYDEDAALRAFRGAAAVFDEGALSALADVGNASAAPIFVLGMPRSGSTLVEQILASHPQIHGAGELSIFDEALAEASGGPMTPQRLADMGGILDTALLQRLAAAYLARLPSCGKAHIVDKMPANFLYAGLIRLAFPRARIIHTLRDPLDTCLSCYGRLFSEGNYFSYDLSELGRYYLGYSALADHWRVVLPQGAMLEVRYEDVVADLEGQARRLLSYCGLPWDGSCLEFHKTGRPIKTASDVQVRRPLYGSSVQRWRRFAAELEPLRRLLEDAPLVRE
jgi:tetratricopeptide (TPR) repeat protein